MATSLGLPVFVLGVLGLALLGCPSQEVGPAVDSGAAPVVVVTVAADGQEASVDLSTLATEDVAGEPLVPVTSVLDASGLEVAWAERSYAFTATDGFTPGDVGCAPVDYATVEGAWLAPASGNLEWDAELDMQGCYFVTGVARVDAEATPER